MANNEGVVIISADGLDYLRDEYEKIIYFEDFDAARAYLRESGYTETEIKSITLKLYSTCKYCKNISCYDESELMEEDFGFGVSCPMCHGIYSVI